jgi:hypothetical protein
MEWIVSNRKRELTIAVLVAVAAFGTVFLLTGAIMTQVYGIKPGDPDYVHYGGLGTGNPDNTPYQDFIANGCFTKQLYEGNTTGVLDTMGLEELGLPYYDPNTCFDLAKTIPGYVIDKVETYTAPDSSGYFEDEHMKIIITKK